MGGLLYSAGNPIKAIEIVFGIMSDKIGDNAYILVFLVLLGILVALITKSVHQELMVNGHRQRSNQDVEH